MDQRSKMKPAALGFRAHSGWAALVAVAAGADGLAVVERRRIELADPALPGSVQPYHAADGNAFRDASALIQRFERSARRLAVRGVTAVAEDVGKKGFALSGVSILMASGRALPGLEAILSSHALIHAADGEHFRDALAHASESLGFPIVRVRERELSRRAEEALGRPAPELQAEVASLGRSLGPPWTQDQKLAALAGWLALARPQAVAGKRGR